MKPRNAVVIYKSFYLAIEQLGKRDQLNAYKAIMRYGLYGEFPEEMSAGVRVITELAFPLIDKCAERYERCVENGKKGGRPKTEPQ